MLKSWMLASFCVISFAWAQEDADLQYIPSAAKVKKVKQIPRRRIVSRWKWNLSFEEAISSFSNRPKSDLSAPVTLPLWQSLSAADLKFSYQFSRSLNFSWSERFNILAEDDFSFPSQQSFRDNWREGYITYEPIKHFFVEAGRINVRNGVALGYNPTDYLKARTLISQTSLDPASLRKNRLGVIMGKFEMVGESESFSFLAVPRIASELSLNSPPPPTFDPQFGRTNSESKVLASLKSRRFELSPELLVFNDVDGLHIGSNLSTTIGNSMIFYAEWSAAKMQNISQRALNSGKATGVFPAGLTTVPQTDSEAKLSHDTSVGFSWTSENRLTVNLEYIYHQVGLTQEELESWSNLALAQSALLGQLWYVRQFAQDQQEPLMQRQLFIRFACPDFLIQKNNTDLLAFVNPGDASVMAQLSSEYLWSDHFSLTGVFMGFFGSEKSQYGTMPVTNSFSLRASYYF